jgi:hypothetical protein
MPSIVAFLMKRPLIVIEKTGDENRRTVVESFRTEHAVIEESHLRDPIFLLRDNFHYDALIRVTNPLLEMPTFPVHEIDEDQREAPQMRALNIIGFQVLIQLYHELLMLLYYYYLFI